MRVLDADLLAKEGDLALQPIVGPLKAGAKFEVILGAS